MVAKTIPPRQVEARSLQCSGISLPVSMCVPFACVTMTPRGPARACNVACACLLLLFAVKQVQGGCEHLCVRHSNYT